MPTLPTAICVDGRHCYKNSEVIAHTGVYSLLYANESPLFSGFYLGVIITTVGGIINIVLILILAYYRALVYTAAKRMEVEIRFWYDFVLDYLF